MGNKKSIGLRGGPNEFLQTFTDNISIEGYRRNSPDVNKLFNVIPSGDISMKGVDFPVVGTDNLGNTKTMQPGMNYQFPGDSVLETRLAQKGTEVANYNSPYPVRPPDTMSAYEEPSWGQRTLDILASPMTSFGYKARNQDIPDALPLAMEDRNAFDNVIDMVNPFAWIKYGQDAKTSYDKGEYLDATFSALGAIPIVPAYLSRGKKVAPAIKNAAEDSLTVVKDAAEELVSVWTNNGIKKIPKSDAIKLNRIEDANVRSSDFIGEDGFLSPENGNWVGNSVEEFYANLTKRAANTKPGKSQLLNSDEARRLYEIMVDRPTWNSVSGTNMSKRAQSMSGGPDVPFHPGEGVLSPALMDMMREAPIGDSGFFKTSIVNSEDALRKAIDFYKKRGGELPKAQLGWLGKIVKQGIKAFPNVIDDAGRFAKSYLDDSAKFTTEGLENATYKIGRKETGNVTRKQLDEVVGTRKSWINSDDYFKRRSAQLKETDKFKNASDIDIKNYVKEDVKSMENAFDQISVQFTNDVSSNGVYLKNKIRIKTPDGSGVGYNPSLDNFLDIFDHEVLHAFQSQSANINPGLLKSIYSIAKGKLAKGQSIDDIKAILKGKGTTMEDISSGFYKGQRHMTTPINPALKNSTSGPGLNQFTYLSEPVEQNVRHMQAIESLVSKYGYNYGKVSDDLLSKFSDDVINGKNKFGVDDLFRNIADDSGKALKPGSKGWNNIVKPILENAWMFPATGVGLGLSNQKFGGSLSKAQVGGEQGKTWRDIEINKEGLKRAIAEVESINGVLMINPESTATGLYGQRFSELEEGNLYEGTRGEFAKDLEAQERIFDMRLNEGIKSNKTTPLLKDAFDLTNEYKDQLGDKWNYSYEDLIALSNFLGRGGTREFLGNVIRDGKTLEEVYPTKFGKGAKQANKTPYEYLKKTRDYYQEGGDVNYTVVEGDNLGRIANKYKTSVDELARLNNISDPNKININQELIISQSKKPAAITNSYNVRSGDTLGKIAKTYNTTAKKLAEYNSIEDMNMIQVNQQIAIPDNIRKQVKKSEPAWYGVDDVKARNIETNSGSDSDIIMTSQLLNNPNQSYVIIDKKSGQLRVMNGEDEALSFEVLTGANPGDAQTVTKMKDLDGDGKITDADKINNQWVTDWSGGNKSTGAGIYSIGSSSPTSKPGYQDAPSWTLKNDNGIAVSTAIHGTTNYRKQFFNDGSSENNQASNGCINGQCSDLDALYDLDLPMGTPIFILPEDEGNNFVLQDGKAIMKMSQKNRSEYLNYTDSEGRTQKGQGGNYTTNSLIYKPIRSKFNEEKFREEVFSVFDFDDEEELKNTTLPFIQALQDNKREIMLKAQIPGDVYNQIAKMSFGVFGLESNFGDTHSWAGNAARGANKKYGNDKSSPDVVKKYEGFNLPFTEVGAGATKDNNSVGYTQIRWSELNDKEKSALKSFDITSNEDFFDPKKSAIATATILGIRYNEQLTTDQKKDIWKYLPTKWNKRSNYVKRVKDFSVYLDFEQKDVMGNGGETENHIMYKNYVNGVYEGSKMQIKGAKIYDKLNRIHYRDAKASNMAPANYVMTNVIG